jgi:hypothetical protein
MSDSMVLKAWIFADRIKRILKKAAEEEQNEEARKAIKDILMHVDMLSVELQGLVEEVLKKRTQENIKIERKEEKKEEEKATDRQIDFLKRLHQRLNIPFNEQEARQMSKKEASEKIEELMGKGGRAK